MKYEKLFEMDGMRLTFTDKAVEAIADRAIALKTGARGLRTVIENAMKNIMFELPDKAGEIKEVTITDRTITSGADHEITYIGQTGATGA